MNGHSEDTLQYFIKWASECGDTERLKYLVHRYGPGTGKHSELLRLQTAAVLELHLSTQTLYEPPSDLTETGVAEYNNYLSAQLPERMHSRIVSTIRELRIGRGDVGPLVALIRDLQDSSIVHPTPSRWMALIDPDQRCWPVWILWLYIFDRPLTERQRYELVCYRYVFAIMLQHLHLNVAAQVYLWAMNPRSSESSINELLLQPAVIRGITMGLTERHRAAHNK